MQQDDNLLPQLEGKILSVPEFNFLPPDTISLLRKLYNGEVKTVTGLEMDAIEAPSKTLQNGKTRLIEGVQFRIKIVDSPKLTEGWTDATQEES